MSRGTNNKRKKGEVTNEEQKIEPWSTRATPPLVSRCLPVIGGDLSLKAFSLREKRANKRLAGSWYKLENDEERARKLIFINDCHKILPYMPRKLFQLMIKELLKPPFFVVAAIMPAATVIAKIARLN